MWFNGPITEAINKTKCEKTLLIVYIYDDNDEKSHSMTNCWQDEEVKSVCNENKCVALKFDGKSQAAKQFSEFYPLVSVPSIFFIDYEGKPLEIIVKSITALELRSQLQKALLMSENKQGTSAESTNCVLTSNSNAQTTPSGNLSTDENIKDLIKENNEKNEKQEAENEKKKELNRREEGQSITQAREKQKEREILAAAEERKRDKIADREHLRILREQIAADREEKKAKYDAMKASENAEIEKKKQEKLKKTQEENEKVKQEMAERCKITKLQFRMPDGTAVSETFNSDQILSDAYKFVESALNLRESFCLIQMYPRREFTDSDMGMTFIELDLTPSAVLMVLQERRRHLQMQPYQDNWFVWFFSILTAPFLFIYNWLYSMFYGNGTDRNRGDRPAGSSSQPKSASGNFGRGDGNIHRMPGSGQGDNPDDNATYNGNSTQQL